MSDQGEGEQREAEQQAEEDDAARFEATPGTAFEGIKHPVGSKIQRNGDSDEQQALHRAGTHLNRCAPL